ncbi:MAG: N-acetylmuramoyl-L-alanine amidase [Gemmatimonadota bacterium]|nr:N-acetylmuramoyl-L-alanine amidase [Gemmatimonadota bacterium]
MILALATAFQLAAATPGDSVARPTSLLVKDATHSASIALVNGIGGPLLRAEQLKPIVPITVSHLTGNRWMLIVNGAGIEVTDGVRYARVGDQTYQLAASPEVRKGALYIPLQLLAEIVPRLVPNLIWDATRFELRAFSSGQKFAAREATTSSRSSGPSRAANDPTRAAPQSPAATTSNAPLGPLRQRRLVVVDAGHGGPDGGMHGGAAGGPDVQEKNITLSVSKRVGAALGQRGIDVKYTRTTDTLIALWDRGRIANDAKADLFVSIHVNAANPGWKNPGGARGFETYFLAEAKTEDAKRVERMENEVVRYESGTPAQGGDALSFILTDMKQNEHLREANELADIIQRRVGQVHPGTNRGVKQAGFAVLVKAYMPAVLVEIGYGTNPSDAAYMSDAARMDELAAAIADGVVEYLKRYERRVATDERAGSGGGTRR